MRRQTRLSVETLERRDVPAQFGIPWANGTALTVSFAPDGADVDGSANELTALMARSGLSANVWQREILRAVQAWAAEADVNVGVVVDDGSPLGAAGLEQADARFGDIRVFAVPLASSVLAITTPPGDLAGTRTGDIILNSNYTFGIGNGAQRDLYTVFLQEAGHAFGVANSPNTDSVMYEFYQGERGGLSAEDVDKIQRLYGARPALTWEPDGGNNTSAIATPLGGLAARVTYGDMASANDTDWYSFTATSGSATVQLQVAGLSLVSARVGVFNSELTRIGFDVADGPGQDLTVALPLLVPGAQYYIRVMDKGGTPFAAGQYRLRVGAAADASETVTLAGQPPVDDVGTNESFLFATRLDNVAANGGTEYRAFARLRSGDVDVYRVRSPFPGLNQVNVLTATVRAFGDIAPKVTVTNFLGLPVAARLAADGNGLYTVVVSNALPNADYHLAVESRTGTAGDYELGAGFRSVVTTPHEVDSGLLTLLNPIKTGTIDVTGSAQIYFRLTSALTPVVGPSVVVRVYDSMNCVRFQLLARAGEVADGVALLGPGQYRVEVSGNGTFLPNVLSGFSLAMALLTDPVGMTPSDPNNPGGTSEEQPPPPPPSGYNYYNDTGYYTWGEQTPSGGG
jgi:Matrixin